MKSVVIIGGGASGMMAAISAARAGAAVTLLEAGRRPGSKLLLTGNGRCNLTNLDPDLSGKYASQEGTDAGVFAASVLRQLSVTDTLRLFEECGLLTMTEHGTYVYPVTGKSESVLNVLLRELQRLKVKMKYNARVTGIDRENGTWLVRTDGWSYPCDSVILCCGSRAVPSTGSDGMGYELCRGLGLEVTDILPALTAVRCRLDEEDCRPFEMDQFRADARRGNKKARQTADSPKDPLQEAAGTRMRAEVSAYADGTLLCSEEGQIQFTQTDLSGIVVFNVSRFVTRALRAGKDVQIRLNLLPEKTTEELEQILRRLRTQRPEDPMSALLAGILPPGLIGLFSGESDPAAAARRIRSLPLRALRLRDFDNCQVCAGGVRLRQMDPDTLECAPAGRKGIFIAGELADIDGPCGGYNLQWAWSSGYTAGLHAAMD